MSSANEGNTHFLISRLHSLPQSATFFLSAAHPSDYSLCLAHGSIALSLHTSDLLRCSSAPSLVAPSSLIFVLGFRRSLASVVRRSQRRVSFQIFRTSPCVSAQQGPILRGPSIPKTVRTHISPLSVIMWSWFGGAAAQKRKDAPKNAILMLREQLDMLQKRETHLANQMDEQENVAKKNISTNKNGMESLVLR